MTDSSSKKISVAGIAEMGSIKTVNEDAYESYTCGPDKIYLIASGSGVGTSGKGKVALDMVLSAFKKFFKEHEASPITHEEIVSTIRDVNRDVFERSLEEPKYAGMAVSLTMALIAEQRVYVVHVGNTRMYMISGPRIEQLTKDHTLAEELKRTGAVGSTTPSSPMSQVLTRAIGKAPHIEPDVFSFATADLSDNRLFACTKGLYNRLEDHELLEELLEGAPDVALAKTIKRAKDKSPSDNLAIVVIDPNGHVGEGSSANSNSLEAEDNSTQDKGVSSSVKDAVAAGDSKDDSSSSKTEKEKDPKAKSSGAFDSGSIEGSKTASSSSSRTAASPFSSPPSSGGGFSSAAKTGPNYPSSPFSALVAPSVESTGARLGIDTEERPEAKDGAQMAPAQNSSARGNSAGALGPGQPPPGFEQESSGHLKAKGSSLGSDESAPGALRGVNRDAGSLGGRDQAGLSSIKKTDSLETSVSRRGEPRFDEEESNEAFSREPSSPGRGALSKLGRAIVVGIIGGTLLGRIFNTSPTEQAKPNDNSPQQVAEVGAGVEGKKRTDSKRGKKGDSEHSDERPLASVSSQTTVSSSANLAVNDYNDKARVESGLIEGDVDPASIGTQEEASGLARALGRRPPIAKKQRDSAPDSPSGGAPPEQAMRARAGLPELVGENKAASVGVTEGGGGYKQGSALQQAGSIDASSTKGRGPTKNQAAVAVVDPQAAAKEVLNKFPQLAKITDPDLRLMLTDVLTAFEETAMISKRELVEVEAERQRLDSRVDVLERLITENIANKNGATQQPDNAVQTEERVAGPSELTRQADPLKEGGNSPERSPLTSPVR